MILYLISVLKLIKTTELHSFYLMIIFFNHIILYVSKKSNKTNQGSNHGSWWNNYEWKVILIKKLGKGLRYYHMYLMNMIIFYAENISSGAMQNNRTC